MYVGCRENEFKCNRSGICVQGEKTCDYENHCDDGSDEGDICGKL